MNHSLFLGMVGGLALVGAGCAGAPPVQEPVACTMDAMQCPDGSYVGRVAPSCQFAPCPPAPVSPASKDDLITVNAPLPGATVTSPLVVTGEARGNWYFEASFPVEIRDANQVLLGQGVAQAQTDWMTVNYVPFTLILPFTTPTTSTGTLILKKDNPSGEPQNDNQLVIPIVF